MGRRAKGEGGQGYRKDLALFYAYFTLPTGKRRWFYGKTQAAATKKKLAAQRLLAQGKLPSTDRATLADWLPIWLENKRAEGVAPATHIKYEGHIRKHILPALGHVRLSALTPQQLRDFYAAKGREGLAPKTVAGIHGVIYAALKQAMVDETIPRNVAALVTVSEGKSPEAPSFTADQARRFMRAIEGDRYEGMYVLMITTGLRLGELLGLRWRDIDTEHGILSVRQAQRVAYKGWEMAAPKTEAGVRQIALSPDTLAILAAHRGRQDMERLWAGAAWKDNDLVFPRPDGAPLHRHHWRDDEYYPLLERAGLPRLKPHGIRHTFASLLLKRGIPLKFVSEMLGHSSISITADIYGHVELESQRHAVSELDRLLREPEN